MVTILGAAISVGMAIAVVTVVNAVVSQQRVSEAIDVTAFSMNDYKAARAMQQAARLRAAGREYVLHIIEQFCYAEEPEDRESIVVMAKIVFVPRAPLRWPELDIGESDPQYTEGPANFSDFPVDFVDGVPLYLTGDSYEFEGVAT